MNRSRERGPAFWKWLVGPWMIGVTLLAYLWAKPLNNGFQSPEAARIIFWHVPMAMLGLVWFWIGAVHGVRYLYGKRRGDPGMDAKIHFANEVGLICTILATLSGMVFAAVQWGTPWNWDPKQVSISVLILLYLAYFGVRMSVEQEGLRARLSAVYSIFGAVATPVLFYVIPNLPQIAKLHPPASTITSGLDPKWRLIYWASTLGFLWTTLWLYELRLRTAAVEEALEVVEAPATEVRLQAMRRPAA